MHATIAQDQMSSDHPIPTITILEKFDLSPPPATIGDRSLSLTFYDFLWLLFPPAHNLFFYDLPISKSHFIETIIPNLKNSLSITLQHFFPFVGNLILFPTPNEKPEIRYVEGDSVVVTFAECTLDFNDLTGNHPRDCDKFYHLIPLLGDAIKESDYVKIPIFTVQVTIFPNHGMSIGITNHHCLGDANTKICFLKAWTSIARFGSDELFVSNGTLPLYERLINYPKLDEVYLKRANIESLYKEYRHRSLLGPTDKVRATFILKRNVINLMKTRVLTQVPTLSYVSSFTVSCAYIWSCIAESRKDELELFGFSIDCRARIDPPIPTAYFGNCLGGCITIAKTSFLMGSEGFINAAKLLGENLHKILTDKGGIVKDIGSFDNLFSDGVLTTTLSLSGTPKLKYYDMDFGWGKPKKYEVISIDYNGWVSMNASKESNEDLEIGICLSATEMEAFDRIFNDGLKMFI